MAVETKERVRSVEENVCVHLSSIPVIILVLCSTEQVSNGVDRDLFNVKYMPVLKRVCKHSCPRDCPEVKSPRTVLIRQRHWLAATGVWLLLLTSDCVL